MAPGAVVVIPLYSLPILHLLEENIAFIIGYWERELGTSLCRALNH
jgi:hypothetical protein